jgi:hypothetical protein
MGRIPRSHKHRHSLLIPDELRCPPDQHARAHRPEQADPPVARAVIQTAIERRRRLVILDIPRLPHAKSATGSLPTVTPLCTYVCRRMASIIDRAVPPSSARATSDAATPGRFSFMQNQAPWYLQFKSFCGLIGKIVPFCLCGMPFMGIEQCSGSTVPTP